MQISSTKRGGNTPQKPPVQGKEYIQSQIPCHTDDYVLRTKAMVPVVNPTAETYRKVCGASGAARGAVVGHAAMFVGGAALGVALGNVMFPGSGVVAGAVGGALGLVGGGYLHAKTLLGRRVGSVAGAIVGQAISPAVKALRVEVSEERAEITKDFSLTKLVKNGGDFFHSSIPSITREGSQNFVDRLQPGDVVLTKHEGSTIFNLLTYLPSGQYDFNHSILYIGGGKAIEATTGRGVHEFDLAEELTHKHHCIAVRPELEEGQAPKIIAAAREMKGKAYDYLFKNTTNTLYCSELIDHSYEVGAPQVKFNESSFLTKAFVLPGDLLKTDGEVVAEAGEHHSYLNGMASKFS
jgi:uncharacterized protein YycO